MWVSAPGTQKDFLNPSKPARYTASRQVGERQMIEQDGRLLNRAILGKIALIYELPEHSTSSEKTVFIFLLGHHCIHRNFPGLCDYRFWG
jgi:hypothetical protein